MRYFSFQNHIDKNGWCEMFRGCIVEYYLYLAQGSNIYILSQGHFVQLETLKMYESWRFQPHQHLGNVL